MTKGTQLRLACLGLCLVALLLWSAWIFSRPLTQAQAAWQGEVLVQVYQWGNYVEAGIWGLMAIAFAVQGTQQFSRGDATRSGQLRRRDYSAAIVFFLFGLSDVVEVQTGAWWRPWWLLLWKSACVLAMLLLLAWHLRSIRRSCRIAAGELSQGKLSQSERRP